MQANTTTPAVPLNLLHAFLEGQGVTLTDGQAQILANLALAVQQPMTQGPFVVQLDGQFAYLVPDCEQAIDTAQMLVDEGLGEVGQVLSNGGLIIFEACGDNEEAADGPFSLYVNDQFDFDFDTFEEAKNAADAALKDKGVLFVEIENGEGVSVFEQRV